VPVRGPPRSGYIPHVEPTVAIEQCVDEHAAVLDYTRRLLPRAEGAATDRLEPLSVVAKVLLRVVDGTS
jgi:hypothetical protein